MVPLPVAPLGGRYEVLAELGSGGMGKVFIARAVGASGFQRLFAVKVLHPHLAAETEFVAMFLDEGRLAARIHHANVVPTLDIGDGPDGHFIVMDYVEGDTLAGLVERSRRLGGRLPLHVALRIVLDALEGLHAAHEVTGDDGQTLQLVHRDVSPDNLVVGIDGVSRLTDFGVARARHRLHSTRDPRCKGKHAYMPPEQLLGSRDIDRRADVYAMGVLLWECLVGERLFGGQGGEPSYERVLRAPIPEPRSVAPEVPQALSDVVMRALERDRARRYTSAADLANALEAAAAAEGITVARPSLVGQLVTRLSGEKLAAERRRVRAAIERGSAAPPAPRLAPVVAKLRDHAPVGVVIHEGTVFTTAPALSCAGSAPAEPEDSPPWEPDAITAVELVTMDRTGPGRGARPLTVTLPAPGPFPVPPPPRAAAAAAPWSRARHLWLVGVGSGVLVAAALAVASCVAYLAAAHPAAAATAGQHHHAAR